MSLREVILLGLTIKATCGEVGLCRILKSHSQRHKNVVSLYNRIPDVSSWTTVGKIKGAWFKKKKKKRKDKRYVFSNQHSYIPVVTIKLTGFGHMEYTQNRLKCWQLHCWLAHPSWSIYIMNILKCGGFFTYILSDTLFGQCNYMN